MNQEAEEDLEQRVSTASREAKSEDPKGDNSNREVEKEPGTVRHETLNPNDVANQRTTQSNRKRKASDSLANPSSKLPRRSLSKGSDGPRSDIQTNQDEHAGVVDPSNTPPIAACVESHNAEDSVQPRARLIGQSGVGDGFENSSPVSKEVGASHKDTSAEAQGHKKAEAKGSQEHGDTNTREEDFERMYDQADKLWKHIAQFIEARRYNLNGQQSPLSTERERAVLIKLVEVADERRMMENPFLRGLSVSWFSEMNDLGKQLKHTQGQEVRQRQCLDDLNRLHDAVDDLISTRTGILVGASELRRGQEQSKDHHLKISRSREKLAKAVASYKSIQAKIDKSKLCERQLGDIPHHIAERRLIKLGYLGGARTAQDRTQDRTQDKIPNNDHPFAGDDRHSAHVQTSNEDHPPSKAVDEIIPRAMQDIIRETKRKNLIDARKANSDASKNAVDVRENYTRELVRFLYQRREGLVTGTKTDFDGGWFLEQNRATHDLGVAIATYEFAKKEAKMVGATSDVASAPEECGEKDGAPYGAVWELKREEIEMWQADLDHQDAVSCSQWHLEVPELDSGGKSIISVAETIPQAVAFGMER